MEGWSRFNEAKLFFINAPTATKAHPPIVIMNTLLQNALAVIPSFPLSSLSRALLLLLFDNDDDDDDEVNKLSRSRSEPTSLYRVVMFFFFFFFFLLLSF
jgi:hypothetical protein